jgi:thiol-disulfide isomerase/thioredoxin
MRIIKIGAVWCPGCLVMKKVWNKIISDYKDLDITNLDYDMDNLEVSKYNAGKILPIVIFLDKNGNELERLIGEKSEEELIGMIDKYENN